MKALSKEQANALRANRGKVRQLIQLSDELCDIVTRLCKCEANKNCYICRICLILSKSHTLLDSNQYKEGLAALWDDALEHGPGPNHEM